MNFFLGGHVPPQVQQYFDVSNRTSFYSLLTLAVAVFGFSFPLLLSGTKTAGWCLTRRKSKYILRKHAALAFFGVCVHINYVNPACFLQLSVNSCTVQSRIWCRATVPGVTRTWPRRMGYTCLRQRAKEVTTTSGHQYMVSVPYVSQSQVVAVITHGRYFKGYFHHHGTCTPQQDVTTSYIFETQKHQSIHNSLYVQTIHINEAYAKWCTGSTTYK